MTISVSSVVAKYAGIQPVEFHTYTTTYASFDGASWHFNPNALNPMEFWGFINQSNPVGIYARAIDLTTGYTTVACGNNDPALRNTNGTFRQPAWQNNRLNGFCFGEVNALNTYVYSIGMALGNSYTTPVFSPVAGVMQPPGVNNFAPQSGFAVNIPCGGGNSVAGSFVTALNPTYIAATGVAIGFGNAGLDLGISNTFQTINGIAVLGGIGSGTSWVQAQNPGSNADRKQLLSTDFLHAAIQFQVAFENPPGGADIDDLMTQHGNHGNSTYQGFMYISKTTIVVEGKTLNGFGILVAPDYSSYRIIQLIPRDSNAAAWTSTPGEFEAKIDRSGAVWLKNFNSTTTLFVSSGNLFRVLPIFPPLPVPGGTDFDPSLRMMRATLS